MPSPQRSSAGTATRGTASVSAKGTAATSVRTASSGAAAAGAARSRASQPRDATRNKDGAGPKKSNRTARPQGTSKKAVRPSASRQQSSDDKKQRSRREQQGGWTPATDVFSQPSNSCQSFSSSSSSDASLTMKMRGVGGQALGNANATAHASHNSSGKPYIAFLEDVTGDGGPQMGSSRSNSINGRLSADGKLRHSTPANRGLLSPPHPQGQRMSSEQDAQRQSDTERKGGDSGDGGVVPLLRGANREEGRRIQRRQLSDTGTSADSPTSVAMTILPNSPLAALHASTLTSDEACVHTTLDNLSRKALQHVQQPRAASRVKSSGDGGGSAGTAAASSANDGLLLAGSQPRQQQHGQPAAPGTMEAIHEELDAIQRACGFGLDVEEEVRRRAAECGVQLQGPWMAAAVAPSLASEWSRARAATAAAAPQRATVPATSTLDSLSAATLLRVLQCCDMASLGQLARVNARLHVLTQYRDLWATQAARMGLQVGASSPEHRPTSGCSSASRPIVAGDLDGCESAGAIKDAIKSALRAKKHRDEGEVVHCEQQLSALKQRMAARTEANYRQSIDVNRTLATHNPQAILTGAFPKHGHLQQRMRRNGDGTWEVVSDDNSGGASSAEKYRTMLQQLRSLEAARGDMLALMEANAKTLEQQQRAINELQQRTTALLRAGTDGNADGGTTRAPAAEASDGGATALHEGAGDVFGRAFLPFTELCAFERRIARLVVNGGFNSNTAVASAVEQEVPLALRRGVADFGTLELFLLSLSASCSAASVAPTGRAPSSVVKAILARWAAFQAFCPLSEDYYLVRQLLRDSSAGERRRVSKRLETALLRYSAVVRKVNDMRDHEVLSVVM